MGDKVTPNLHSGCLRTAAFAIIPIKQNPMKLYLIDVAKRCANERDKIDAHWAMYANEQRSLFTGYFKYHQADFGDCPKSKKDLIQIFGRKWRTAICNLVSFVNLYKFCTSRKHITELGISTTTKQLVEIFHHQRTVSFVLQQAQKAKLLFCVENEYRFKGKGKFQEAYSKRYIYNKKVQKLIIDVAKAEGIEPKPYTKKNRQELLNANVGSVSREMREKIKVGTGLKIDGSIDDETIKAILDERYPMVKRCQELADIDNLKLRPEEQIKCEWNITRSEKYITKIGFRATSGIVSLKAHENENKNYSGVWRSEYLAERFNGKKVYEFDVKSSIFRVTFWLNFGHWLDNSIDLYRLMYGQKFKTDEERLAYKVFKMRTYFDKGNDVAKHIMPVFSGCVLDDLKKMVNEDIERQEKVIGKSWGSEVFVWESCIYMELVHRLREEGLDVVQVYDGFYSNRKIKKKSKTYLSEIVSEYDKKYQMNLKSRILKSDIEIKNHIKECNIVCINSSNIQDSHSNICINSSNIQDVNFSFSANKAELAIYERIKDAYAKHKIGARETVELVRLLHGDLDDTFVKFDPNWKPKDAKAYSKSIQKLREDIHKAWFTDDDPLPAGTKLPNLKDYMDVGL